MIHFQFFLSKRFDIGKIVSKVSVPIPWDMKRDALTEIMAHTGAQELVTVLQELPNYLQAATDQPTEGITKGS